MFKRSIAKEKPGEVLPNEDYMSAKALEVFTKKYTSAFSESQRTTTFSKSLLTSQSLEDAKQTLSQALNTWMERQVAFADLSKITLGLRLAPVLQGTKVKLVVTAVINTATAYRVTFFHEDDQNLSWTTFTLSVPLFKKSATRFTMQLTIVANYVHERMSPLGAGNRVIMHDAFRKSFKSFVAAYNQAHQEQTAKAVG